MIVSRRHHRHSHNAGQGALVSTPANKESNFEERRRDVQKLIVKVGNALKVTSGDKRQTLDRNTSADTPAARQRTPTTSSGDRSGGAS